MKNMVLSVGWSISSIFILSSILYLLIVKRKQTKKSNRAYNLMIISLVISILLEILSAYTISIVDKIPVITEIVSKAYLYSVLLFTLTTFEHMMYYDAKMNKKFIRMIELFVIVAGLVMCILAPVRYKTEVPYAVAGILPKLIICYIGIGGIGEIILIVGKKVNLKDTSVIPYIFTFSIIIILGAYQIITDNFMNYFTPFCTFIVMYQFYNTESSDAQLLQDFEKTKEQSDAKNKERDEFIANLSREIRTPMSNMMGYSNLIKLDNDKLTLDVVKRDGNEIHKEALNLLNIINNILDLSRFEAGKEKKEEREYSFETLVLDINNDLINTYKDMRLSYKFQEGFPNDLYGDDLKIEKLVQLICEYISKDRIGRSLLIDFSYKNLSDQDIEETITFSLANVSIESSLRQNKLDLESQIIDCYNGVLGCSFNNIQDSDNNKICSLVITQKALTSRRIEKLEEKIIASSNSNNEETIADYSDKTILIVDDSQMNINIAKRLFEKYKFNIEEAVSGNECIKLVQEKKYDIIFLDDMMPGLSGVQTLGELKEMGVKLPPVVALTANSYDGLKDEYMKNGFTDYLAKPIKSNKLDKLITDLLGGGK